eukprot:TRINITY_DN3017_c0_g1_i2.p3 TRINITY_DN3017_c0_g1~~TRINITY_DN3017_c0_g1_i2.p3  ORF type:complete len:139 (-),score=13.60 TRINITY_DN3017_c0_g1_i2:154-570(-)
MHKLIRSVIGQVSLALLCIDTKEVCGQLLRFRLNISLAIWPRSCISRSTAALSPSSAMHRLSLFGIPASRSRSFPFFALCGLVVYLVKVTVWGKDLMAEEYIGSGLLEEVEAVLIGVIVLELPGQLVRKAGASEARRV